MAIKRNGRELVEERSSSLSDCRLCPWQHRVLALAYSACLVSCQIESSHEIRGHFAAKRTHEAFRGNDGLDKAHSHNGVNDKSQAKDGAENANIGLDGHLLHMSLLYNRVG